MNTEKITNQLNKKMDELVGNDLSNFSDINVGMELELIFDIENFEQNHKEDKENKPKNKEKQSLTGEQNIKEFQGILYNYIFNGRNNKINFDFLEKFWNDEYIKSIQEENESFISHMFGYYKHLFKLAKNADKQSFFEMVKDSFYYYLQPIFSGKYGFDFKLEDKKIKVTYTNKQGQEFEMPKHDYNKKKEIYVEFFDDYQQDLFQTYDSKVIKTKEPLTLKSEVGFNEDNILEHEIENDYESIFRYPNQLRMEIEMCGMTPMSTQQYERRLKQFQTSIFHIISYLPFTNTLDNIIDENNVGKSLFEQLFNNVQTPENVFVLDTYELTYEFERLKGFMENFAQSLIEIITVSYMTPKNNALFVPSDRRKNSLYDFWDTINRLYTFQQIYDEGYYREQIQYLQTYNIKNIIKDYDKYKNIIKKIQEYSEIPENVSDIYNKIDRFKVLSKEEKLKFQQSIFSKELEKTYKDFQKITKGNEILFSQKYHGIDDENKKEHLTYEYDSSISISPDYDKRKIGFEMVTPVIKYPDQKNLFNFLINNKDKLQIEVNYSTGLHLNVSSNNFDFLNIPNDINSIDYTTLQYLLDELTIQLKIRLPSILEFFNEIDLLGKEQGPEHNYDYKNMKYYIWLYQMNRSVKFESLYNGEEIERIIKQLENTKQIDVEHIKNNENHMREKDNGLMDKLNISLEVRKNIDKIIRDYKMMSKNPYQHKLKDEKKHIYVEYMKMKRLNSLFIELVKYIHNNINENDRTQIQNQIKNIQNDKQDYKYLYILQILLIYFDFSDNEDYFANEFFNKQFAKFLKDNQIKRSFNAYMEDERGTGDLQFQNLILPEYESRIQEFIDINRIDLTEENFDKIYDKLNGIMYNIVKSKYHQFTIKDDRIEFRILGNQYLDKSVLFYFDHIIKCFYQITTDGIKEELSQITKEKMREEIEEIKYQLNQEKDVTNIIDG